MGTLFNQQPRKDLKVSDTQMYDLLSEAKRLAEVHDLSVEEVLLAYKIKELERKNNLMVEDGDKHDEQMSGIGDLLSQISSAIESIAERMDGNG